MPEKKKTAAAAPAVEAPAAEAKESKTRKSAKAPARRGRPPLAPELYVEFSGKQYNVTDIIDRAKADYRATHKVGVQSCKVYVKPEEDAGYSVSYTHLASLITATRPRSKPPGPSSTSSLPTPIRSRTVCWLPPTSRSAPAWAISTPTTRS